MYHNQKNSLKATLYATHSKNKNYIDNTLIQISSYALSNVGFSMDYLYKNNSFYTNISFGCEKGTNWFGTSNPTTLNERYLLYLVDLLLNKSFSSFDYSLQIHYQFTKDKLFSNSRISIGGSYSVRGYESPP